MCKKKIVILSDFGMMNGGAAKVAITHALSFASNTNYSVTYICCEINERAKENLVNSGVEVKCFDLNRKNDIRGAFYYIFNINSYFKLRKYLSELKFDESIVFHVHTYVNIFSSSIFLALRDFKSKVFLTAHDYFTICPNGAHYNYIARENCSVKGNSFQCWSSNCDKRNLPHGILRNIRFFVEKMIFFRYAPKFVSISKLSNRKLLSFGYESTSILNPIFDLPYVSNKASFVERRGLLYIGRPDYEKGFENLVTTCISNNIPLKVIGSVLEDCKFDTNGFESKSIEFLGWCDREQINYHIDHSLAVIMPSLWSEAFGLVALESASRGTPCIVTKNCGAADYFPSSYSMLVIDVDEFDNILDIYNSIQYFDKWQYFSNLSLEAYTEYQYVSNDFVANLERIYGV